MFKNPKVRFAGAALLVSISSAFASGCTSAVSGEAGRREAAAPELPGQMIATSLCSGCHAVGRTGESPHLEALPFRQISLRYPVRNLEEALGEGILVGHPDMPPFAFEPDDIDALLTYIEAIQDPA